MRASTGGDSASVEGDGYTEGGAAEGLGDEPSPEGGASA